MPWRAACAKWDHDDIEENTEEATEAQATARRQQTEDVEVGQGVVDTGCTKMMAALQVEPHNVLTTMAVTTDPTLCLRLCDGWTVEHLEAFGVASACMSAEVPFIAVLGISNEVGSDAHRQWLAHRDAAQDAARTAILPLLRTTE